MISKKSSVALFALTAALQSGVAMAAPLDLPNVVLNGSGITRVRLPETSSRRTDLCWDLDAIGFSVYGQPLRILGMAVVYEDGNLDAVNLSNAGGVFTPGVAYNGNEIIKRGTSGRCVESIEIRTADRVPARGTYLDLHARGNEIVRVARPQQPRPNPVPPPVFIPAPRPAPIYETRVRYSLDLNNQELIANPELIDSFTRDYTVVFAQAEQAGAIRLKAAYDDAFLDEVVVTFGNGTAEKIELGSLVTREGWVVRDGVIYLAKNQSSGILDLTGYGERTVTSITIRAREAQGGNEYTQSGLKPVIEVYGIGRKAESYQVCVANCY